MSEINFEASSVYFYNRLSKIYYFKQVQFQSPTLSQISISSNESPINDSIEDKIYDWLNTQGIFMEEPEFRERINRRSSEIKIIFNSRLIYKRMTSIKKK